MKISEEKIEKISEQILAFLYSTSPKPIYTFNIAKELARDEEFIKKILLQLKEKSLVNDIKKNAKGKTYVRRLRWKLSDAAYRAYKNNQGTT